MLNEFPIKNVKEIFCMIFKPIYENCTTVPRNLSEGQECQQRMLATGGVYPYLPMTSMPGGQYFWGGKFLLKVKH